MAKSSAKSSSVMEPTGVNFDSSSYKIDICKALSWYSVEKDKKDAISYLRKYVSINNKKDLSKFDSVSDKNISSTIGFLARLTQNGNIISPDHTLKIKNHIRDLLNLSVEKSESVHLESPNKEQKTSIKDIMIKKTNDYIVTLDDAIDDFFLYGKMLDLYADLKIKAIPKQYCTYICEFIKNINSKYNEILESTDPYIKESYSIYSKRKLNQLIKMIEEWSEDINKYSQYKKANRKIRVKTIKTPFQQVSKLNFKKEDIELGIKSTSPMDIVGASQVWVYNTKNKKLAVYRTDSKQGIQVKNSSLQNYDPEQSEQKTLKKPLDIIKLVLSAGKVQLRSIVSELTTKNIPVNGRINNECVIVRTLR